MVLGDAAKIALTDPICTEISEKIALSRRIEKHWRLIGWGTIRRGTTILPTLPVGRDDQGASSNVIKGESGDAN